MKRMVWSGLLILSMAVVPTAMAQTVDLVFDVNDLNTNTKTVAAGQTFDAYLVVRGAGGAQGMTGVSVDLTFNAEAGFELLQVMAVPGDLDFSGALDLNNEVLPIINQFIAEFNFEVDNNSQFTDGFGHKSAVVFDLNANGLTDLDGEVLPVINQFIAEFNFEPPVFWTQKVLGTSTYDESVTIFDPVAKSNAGGSTPGFIDDITSVLLKRPDRAEAFGYSGDAIIAKLTFKAKNAGAYTFGFPQAVYINSGFTGNLTTEVYELNLPANLPRVTVQ